MERMAATAGTVRVRWDQSIVTIAAGIYGTVSTTKMQTVGDNCDPEVYRVIINRYFR